jgi:hypothetical protein
MKFQTSNLSPPDPPLGDDLGEGLLPQAFWDYNPTYQAYKYATSSGEETAPAPTPVSQVPAMTRPPGSGGFSQGGPGGEPYKPPLTQQPWFWPAAIAGSFAVLGAIIYFAPEGTNFPLIGKHNSGQAKKNGAVFVTTR